MNAKNGTKGLANQSSASTNMNEMLTDPFAEQFGIGEEGSCCGGRKTLSRNRSNSNYFGSSVFILGRFGKSARLYDFMVAAKTMNEIKEIHTCATSHGGPRTVQESSDVSEGYYNGNSLCYDDLGQRS